jgi:RNAse (barnase) inhibitor barstar
MKVIRLDASDWRTPDDFYSSLLPELGAPAWHGRNLDALWDSIGEGDVNQVQPPFVVELSGSENLPPELKGFVEGGSHLC